VMFWRSLRWFLLVVVGRQVGSDLETSVECRDGRDRKVHAWDADYR
jgi:hypothetical protein